MGVTFNLRLVHGLLLAIDTHRVGRPIAPDIQQVLGR